MKPHLVVVLALLLLAPLGALGWLGLRAARDEQQLVQHRFDEQLEARLGEVSVGIGRQLEEAELVLGRLLDFDRADADALREVARSEPLVRQVFLLSASGQLIHPPLAGPRSASEEEFLTRTQSIWASGDRFGPTAEGRGNAAAPAGGGPAAADAPATGGEPVRGQGGGPAAVSEGPDVASERGWYVWYWDRDVNLIFWKRAVDGRVLGVEVNRMALLAEIIGELPSDETDRSSLPAGRMDLVDADGDVLYAWGRYRPEPTDTPRVSRPLHAPLGSWSLRYLPAPGEAEQTAQRSGLWAALGALAALMLALGGLAVYFVRESGRELREARQRVSFVNQVSHELKTPLTNIRMYAELLEDRLDEGSESLRDYTSVIVSESQRLSRLIANVLSFARHQRGKLALRHTDGEVDETIAQVVEQFGPSLREQQIEVELELDAAGPVRFDGDALGQILGNLLSNVEKYAAAGKRLRVESERDGSRVEIRVIDWGPGIALRAREEIFQPFVRLSGALTDGVAGTGIGLSIARELARLHGGELSLGPRDAGACFVVTLQVDDQKGRDRESSDRRR